MLVTRKYALLLEETNIELESLLILAEDVLRCPEHCDAISGDAFSRLLAIFVEIKGRLGLNTEEIASFRKQLEKRIRI